MGTWTCQRVSKGVKCGYVNPKRCTLCQDCHKARPATKRPTHMAALDLPYEEYVRINGGEFCGVCGALPKPGKRLQRDHEHVGAGKPRGVCCFQCNHRLGTHMTINWMRQALAYLERTA